MRKLFTSLLSLSLAFSGLTAYAENPYAPTGDEEVIGKTQVLYYVDGNAKKLSGSQIGAPEGWSIEINIDQDKKLSKASNITVGEKVFLGFKLSNGAQNIVTLPEGYIANAIWIYSVNNIDELTDRPCYWKEIDGETYPAPDSDYLTSCKDYTHPDVSYFELKGGNSFTFANSGEQPLVVLVVDYTAPDAGEEPETPDPAKVKYVVAYNIDNQDEQGFEVSGTTTKGTQTVKINGNTINCLSFENGWTTEANATEETPANENYIHINPEGGLKAGDVITFTGCINNSDLTKKGGTKLSTADGATTLHTSGNMPNLKDTNVTNHGTYTYTLTQDYPSLKLSRDGNTRTLITSLAVTRAAEEGDTSALEIITSNEETETVIYDLLGRRVQNPSNGIYIINGKKVLVK